MDTIDIKRSELERILKGAADLIRTRVDYKYILILLFLKRISDKWELEFEKAYQKVLSKGLSEKEAREEAKDSVWHDFNLPKEYLWENIRKDVSKLPETLSGAMKTVGELNPELKDIMDRMDFFEFTNSRENQEILRQLVELFSERKLHRVSPDVLGDAYEWIIRYFAPQKAKEGEVYTPREVIKLLIEILDPGAGELVYDPACGSGGMLIGAYDHLRERNGESKARELFLYGQEASLTTLAISKMNLYIHDIRDAAIEYGDTLRFPKFMDGKQLKRFDVVIANPPWNQDGYDESVLKNSDFAKQRYHYGHVPKQYADWAWIQHMLASAKDDSGRVGIVIDNGCLFRGGKEKTIRTRTLEEDLIESVILLPEKLFYNTGAPGAIVILNKNKPQERKGKVLFINTSGEYEQHPEVRKLNKLGEEHIKRISGVYRGEEIEDGFCRLVPLEEIKENQYNLNVTLYVMPEEEVADIDITKEWKIALTIEKKSAAIDQDITELITKGIGHKEYKKTKIGNIPAKWNIVKIEELTNGAKGSIKIGPFGSQLKKIDLASKGIKVYGQENVLTEDFVIGNRYISQEKFNTLRSVEIFPDDVLVTMMGSVGYSIVFPHGVERGIMDSHLIRIQVDKSKCLPEFLARVINDYPSLKYQIKSMSQGAIMSGLNSQIIKNILIPLPSLAEQQKISETLSVIDKKLKLQQEKTEKLGNIKKGLMNELLTGRIRVKV